MIAFTALTTADTPLAKPPSADNTVSTGISGRIPPIFDIGITLGIAMFARFFPLKFEWIVFWAISTASFILEEQKECVHVISSTSQSINRLVFKGFEFF